MIETMRHERVNATDEPRGCLIRTDTILIQTIEIRMILMYPGVSTSCYQGVEKLPIGVSLQKVQTLTSNFKKKLDPGSEPAPDTDPGSGVTVKAGCYFFPSFRRNPESMIKAV